MATIISLSASPLVWAYLALMFFFFFISITYRGVRRDHSVVKGTRTEYLLFLVVNIAFIILPFTYAVTRVYDGLNYDAPPFLAILGLVGLVTAFLIRAKAHVDLGDSFTISPGTRRKRRLVTTGIYSRIRHPMYLAMMIWAISSPLVLHNYLVGMLPLAAISIFLIVRVPLEERILLEEFGDEYDAYAACTGALLPRLIDRAA